MSVFFDFLLPSAFVSGHLLLTESTDKQIFESASQLKCDFWMSQRQLLMLKVDLNFKKLLDTIEHPVLALDHSKAHIFLVGTLTSIEDLFLSWLVKFLKVDIKLNRYRSIYRATGLNGVILRKMASLGKHCWQCLPGNVFLFDLILFRC